MSNYTEQQQANVDLVMTFFNAFLAEDEQTALGTMSEDFKATFFNPAGVKKETHGDNAAIVPWVWPSVGLEGLAKNFEQYQELLNVTHYEVVEALPLGDDRVWVVAYFEATVRATGKSFHCNSYKVIRVEGGKIVHRDSSFDMANMAEAFRPD